MKRTTTSKYTSWSRIPDAVCLQIEDDFTKIPNDILKNPKISSSAKIILFLLFSNKEGWHSYLNSIQVHMKESLPTIQKYIRELEKEGYVKRIYYREKNTKTFRGSFLAYTDIPFEFDLNKSKQILDTMGYEPQNKKPPMAFSADGFFSPNNIKKENKINSLTLSRARKETMKIPPSIEDVREYCEERENNINPEHFISYYDSKDWMVGKNRMKNWKRAIHTWEEKNKEYEKRNRNKAQAQNKYGLGSRRFNQEPLKFKIADEIRN